MGTVAVLVGVGSIPGPSFTSVTRTTCNGRCTVPTNKSVDSTPAIRICSSLHAPASGSHRQAGPGSRVNSPTTGSLGHEARGLATGFHRGPAAVLIGCLGPPSGSPPAQPPGEHQRRGGGIVRLCDGADHDPAAG